MDNHQTIIEKENEFSYVLNKAKEQMKIYTLLVCCLL